MSKSVALLTHQCCGVGRCHGGSGHISLLEHLQHSVDVFKSIIDLLLLLCTWAHQCHIAQTKLVQSAAGSRQATAGIQSMSGKAGTVQHVITTCQDDLAGHKDQQHHLGHQHPVNETREQLWLILQAQPHTSRMLKLRYCPFNIGPLWAYSIAFCSGLSHAQACQQYQLCQKRCSNIETYWG